VLAPIALTPVQQRICAYVREYQQLWGDTPVYREIALACGLTGPSAVEYQIRKLVKIGLMYKPPRLKRAIRINAVPVNSTGMAWHRRQPAPGQRVGRMLHSPPDVAAELGRDLAFADSGEKQLPAHRLDAYGGQEAVRWVDVGTEHRVRVVHLPVHVPLQVRAAADVAHHAAEPLPEPARQPHRMVVFSHDDIV
jgi:SOS-response transcriptional repressor LexA